MSLDDSITPREVKRTSYGHAFMQMIAAGRLGPGYILPARRELRLAWRTGGNTVSEALNLAADAGFVLIVHGDRTEVLGQDRWNVMHPLVVDQAHRSSPRPETFLAQYLQVEAFLEVGTLGELDVAGVDLIAGLEDAQRRMALAGSARRGEDVSPDYHYADSDFHGLLARATGNVVTIGQSRLLRRAQRLEAMVRVASPQDVAHELGEHAAILAAMARGDIPAAVDALRIHLAAMADRMARGDRRPTMRPIDEPGFLLRGWRP